MAHTTNLSFKDKEFTFKGKQLRILSGAIHYFRVVPEYWRDRLLKLKACGLNTVETYVPWNLHEPRPGHFQNEGILDLRKFIQTASDLDLYVIFRPGPYICSEWDFGGLPSWLLADPNMKVRTNYPGYQNAVERYFAWLLPQVLDLQSSKGGPIIAAQVENEYGSFSFDPAHLIWLRDLLWMSGVRELLVTSDNETCARGMRKRLEKDDGDSVDLFHIPGVLPTANGMTVGEVGSVYGEIRRQGRNADKSVTTAGVSSDAESRPLMVMELWSGWFDYWAAAIHETTTSKSLESTVKFAFGRGSSINLYMFHGGTNFGFMNGALQLPPESEPDKLAFNGDMSDPDSYPYRPDVTSYDYDAPLTEDGCITGKYLGLRKLVMAERNELEGKDGFAGLSPVPDIPVVNQRAQHPLVVGGWEGDSLERLYWNDVLNVVSKKTCTLGNPDWMEAYTYPGEEIQSYGYIVYRRNVDMTGNSKPSLSFTGRVRDSGNILINGTRYGTVDWSEKDAEVSLDFSNSKCTLDIIVENQGRVNYTTSDYQDRFNTQRKGIHGPVKLNGETLDWWQIFALDFEGDFLSNAVASDKWSSDEEGFTVPGPALYRGVVNVPGQPKDYFIRMEGWTKGVVFVNGFNLGRYWNKGPTKTLYVPGPLLKAGDNEVVVFEEVLPGHQIVFGIEPNLG